jgi:hypothetical protein
MRFHIYRRASVLYAVFSFVTMPSAAASQAHDDTVEVVRAALAYKLEPYRGKVEVKLDPRILPSADTAEKNPRSATHSNATLSKLAQAGIQITDLETARRCAGSPARECRTRGANIFVALSEPVVKGDTATVVLLLRGSSDRLGSTVSTEAVHLLLARQAGRWSVVRERLDRVT